jgi:predicted nucleic acid-binding protein
VILYLDTSALVKLFSAEPGSDLVRASIAGAEFRACHMIGYAEGCAAIARRCRNLGLSNEEIDRRIAELTRSWLQLDIIETDWPLVERAGHLAVRYRLRGYDSIHLAAAEAISSRVRGTAEFRFAVFDSALIGAARALGIEILEG